MAHWSTPLQIQEQSQERPSGFTGRPLQIQRQRQSQKNRRNARATTSKATW